MYKIYFLDRCLQLGAAKEESSSLPTLELLDKTALLSFIQQWLKDEKRQDLILKGYKAKKMYRHLKEGLSYVKAAGGVVRNRKRQVLFIKRWGIWDLPKGKKEKSETIENCALREVQEETGVDKLSLKTSLPSSYHIYFHRGEPILKKTYWFLMETDFEGELSPQQEEDISQALWLDQEACREALQQSYRSLREFLEESICNLEKF